RPPEFVFGNANQKNLMPPNDTKILRMSLPWLNELEESYKIHEMLDNPRARLFNQEDNNGDIEDYRFLK
ncbi:unnamed protein product, partial [Allacma fusca]